MDTRIDFKTLRVGAILNTASGSCDETAEGKLVALLEEAGIKDAKVWCGDADYMGTAFKEVKSHALDVLIVLGGDGTIRTGAEACTTTGPYLIALPGGTMNMLPKALYGDRSWEAALADTLRAPQVRSVSGGQVAERQFFIAAVLGAPALWAEAREAVRAGDLGDAVQKGAVALQSMFSNKVAYTLSDTEQGEAEALAIICPLISDVMADTERAFESAVINVESATGVLALASTAAFGAWRDDSHVTIVKTKRVHASSDTDIPLILDGETVSAGREVEIRFVPEAFKALIPRATP